LGILLLVPFFRRVFCYRPRLEAVLCRVKIRLVSPIPNLACSSPYFVHNFWQSCQDIRPRRPSVLGQYHILSTLVFCPHFSLFPHISSPFVRDLSKTQSQDNPQFYDYILFHSCVHLSYTHFSLFSTYLILGISADFPQNCYLIIIIFLDANV